MFFVNDTLSEGEGRGEASEWLSKFCNTSTIKPHSSMTEGWGEASDVSKNALSVASAFRPGYETIKYIGFSRN